MGKKTKPLYNDFTEDLRYTSPTTSTIQTHPVPSSSPPPSKPSPPPRPKPTHFLALPLVTAHSRPHLQTALAQFKNDVEQRTNVPVSAVRPVGSLHITLCVLVLESAGDVERAVGAVRGLDGRGLMGLGSAMGGGGVGVIEGEEGGDVATTTTMEKKENEQEDENEQEGEDALTIQISGLHAMHAANRTSVLYAKPVDPERRVLKLAERVKGLFEEEGLAIGDERAVKLHATVLNTVYALSKGRRGKGKGKGKGGEEWRRFDARGLMEGYEGFVWADVKIDRVQLCKMGARKVVGGDGVVDEEYEVVAEKVF